MTALDQVTMAAEWAAVSTSVPADQRAEVSELRARLTVLWGEAERLK